MPTNGNVRKLASEGQLDELRICLEKAFNQLRGRISSDTAQMLIGDSTLSGRVEQLLLSDSDAVMTTSMNVEIEQVPVFFESRPFHIRTALVPSCAEPINEREFFRNNKHVYVFHPDWFDENMPFLSCPARPVSRRSYVSLILEEDVLFRDVRAAFQVESYSNIADMVSFIRAQLNGEYGILSAKGITEQNLFPVKTRSGKMGIIAVYRATGFNYWNVSVWGVPDDTTPVPHGFRIICPGRVAIESDFTISDLVRIIRRMNESLNRMHSMGRSVEVPSRLMRLPSYQTNLRTSTGDKFVEREQDHRVPSPIAQ